MKVALVTTPPDVSSPVGSYVQALLPSLRRCCDVDVFVPGGAEGTEVDGAPTRSLEDLRLREFDQLLYELGNERQHGFMARMIRVLGGTVRLHEWALPELALGAYPALEGGGWRGRWLAVREGGLRQGLDWVRHGRWRSAAAREAEGGELTLNRSVIRHADAFLVDDQELKLRVLEDRNQHTPVAVVSPRIGALHEVGEETWHRIAERYAECLEAFPHARSARRPLIVAAFQGLERGRRKSREAEGRPPES